MSKQQFANNAESFLSAAISAAAVSFSGGFRRRGGFSGPEPAISIFMYGSGPKPTTRSSRSRPAQAMPLPARPTTGAWDAGAAVVLTCSAEALSDLAQADGGGQVLQDHELRDYSETVSSPTISSGALTLDMSAGNVFAVTLTEAVTSLTISNPPASGKAGSFTLILSQDSTGGWSFTWPASITWAGGSAPELTTDAGGVDVLVFLTIDGGATWRGMLAGAAFA